MSYATGNNGIKVCTVNLLHQPSHKWFLIRRKWCRRISFYKDTKNCNFITMAKAKKKSAKESSNIFHNIMAAAVRGNPKPQKKAAKKKA